MSSRARRGTVVAGATAALLVTALPGSAEAAPPGQGVAARMERAVTVENVMTHLEALQAIADANGGNRAAGTAGHAASAGYIAGQLTAAGYDVTYQPFEFPYFSELSPSVFEQVSPTPATYGPQDYVTASYSGSGDVTGRVVPVDVVVPPVGEAGLSNTSGCEAEDFEGFPAGAVALMQRGTCTFGLKAQNALAAGAGAAIIFNEGQEGRTEVLNGTLGAPVGLPVVGTSYELGADLVATLPEVHIATDTLSETRSTYNVIAETPGGNPDNVIVSGAHLDSVPDGPGINDDGSGSAAQLEVALQLAEEVPNPSNKVRFAWWSAEEEGLLGSSAYVESLTEEQLGKIALNLNWDMIASPNDVTFLYDGDDSDAEGAGPGPDGSEVIEDALEQFYAHYGEPTKGTDFDGRSDYGPFIEAGIPSGGTFTGAEGVKTEEEAALWGGTAGEPYDSCYHQACDDLTNVDKEALARNADAIAFAVATGSRTTEPLNGVKSAAQLSSAAGGTSGGGGLATS